MLAYSHRRGESQDFVARGREGTPKTPSFSSTASMGLAVSRVKGTGSIKPQDQGFGPGVEGFRVPHTTVALGTNARSPPLTTSLPVQEGRPLHNSKESHQVVILTVGAHQVNSFVSGSHRVCFSKGLAPSGHFINRTLPLRNQNKGWFSRLSYRHTQSIA